jgi:hypothetical protein
MRTRYRKILVTAALTALALTAIFASAANAATPAPPYQDFAGCPNQAEQPFVGECVKYEFTGGHIGFGNREIPITNTIVLRGAIEQETENFLFNNEGGIVPAQQTVPGGLVGLTGYKWLDEAVASSNQLKLHATVELAGNVGSLVEPTLSLPVKIHLENPFLGSGCYVGSNANPISLHLATTTPLGEFEEEASRPEVIKATGGVFTDASYSVPAANGCVLNLGPIHQSINQVVNSAYSLPAAAGTDSTVLDYSLSGVLQGVVYP